MSKKLLIIDNYDSFTYNLFQYIGELALNFDVEVIRNDALSIEQVLAKNPSFIVISPGPGFPKDAGISEDLISAVRGTDIKLLGVCLGHQAICEVFGGRIVHSGQIVHGKADLIHQAATSQLFTGLANDFQVGRYHSLVGTELESTDLVVTSIADDGEIMSVESSDGQIFGVQFHPESILTPQGKTIIANFLA